jgi:hypothetical protein
MPNWKKIITSGSDAVLNSLAVTTFLTTSGSLNVTGSSIFKGPISVTGSLSVSSSFTASGLNYPAADNGEESFMQTDGSGNLSLQYVKTIYEEIVNGESTQLVKGTPVYVSGSQGAAAIVYRADPLNPLKMPAIYVAADTLAASEAGRGIALGLIKGVNTTGYPEGSEIYLAAGGGFTSTRPTGSAIVQVLGYVTKEGAGGQGVILNPGPANLPNLPSGSVWVGNSSSVPVSVLTSSLSVNSASFALTASYVNPLTQSVFITGSLTVSGSTTSTQIGAGAAPSGSVRLDVRAQGALSTDIGFRVRNTANDRNLIGISGNGDIEVRTNRVSLARSQRINIGGNNTDNAVDAAAYDEIVMLGYNNTNANQRTTILGSSNSCNIPANFPSVIVGYSNTSTAANTGATIIGRNNTGQGSIMLGANNTASGVLGPVCIGNSNTVSQTNGFPTLPMFLIGSNLTIPNNAATNNCVFLSAGSGSGNPFVTIKNDNLLIGTLTPWTSNFDNNSRGVFYTRTGIAPTTLAADSFGLYSADRNGVAGKASPHFRTEDGTVVWLGDESRLFNVTASRTILSSSANMASGSTLTVYGSGSAQPVFTVQGSQGELFSITDSLSGSLFSVNDISGLPILEVFSNGTTLIGNYADPMLITTTYNREPSGPVTIYSLPTSSYDTAFFDYSVRSGSNARAGQIMAIQNGSTVNYTETTTVDFGSTSGVSLGVFVSGSNMVLTGSTPTSGWVIKTIVRAI